jgi:hypothetical protein
LNDNNAPFISRASLDDPLYYLQNFTTVLEWVVCYHHDLLTAMERVRLQNWHQLSEPARALLVRMIMRKGELFWRRQLNYAELGDPAPYFDELIQHGWVLNDPPITVSTLGQLLTVKALRVHFSSCQPFPSAGSKGVLIDSLKRHYNDQLRPASHWCPDMPDELIALCDADLFVRIRLMFFGTLGQDWSSFVVAELGHRRFETVPLSPQSRAFNERAEVDLWLTMDRVREALENDPQQCDLHAEQIPASTLPTPWLEHRRARLLFEAGRAAERFEKPELAMQLYQESTHREALIRRFRVMERTMPAAETLATLHTHRQHKDLMNTQLTALSRIEKRLAKQCGLPIKPQARQPIKTLELHLPYHQSVEQAVADHLATPDAPVFHLENSLFNGLLALLCWPAFYAPLPGAFFHPFQAGPRDLIHENFVSRRHGLFEACLAQLGTREWTHTVRQRFHEKRGLASPLVDWQRLTEEVLELALACIPATTIEAACRRILADIAVHRAGQPDLVQFYREQASFRLIEVKGPGDRLQDHQREWQHFWTQQGIDISVCHTVWQTPPASKR